MRFPVFASLFIVGCTSSPTPPGLVDLQMNDLSVLLPLPTTQAELAAMLTPSSPGVGGVLLPQATFTQASVGFDYASLRAVAFRFDPCFGQLGNVTDPASCENQLRIVWQPLFASTNGSDTMATSAADGGVHAFYSLTREQLLAAVDEMIAARKADGIDSDLGPLAPHPTIKAEGLSGPLAQKLFAIVEKYAGQAELVRMTAFQIEEVAGGGPIIGGGEFWGFQSFDIVDGTANARTIPTLPATATNQMSVSASVSPLESAGEPATTSSDSIATLESMTKATAATTDVRKAAFGAALRIENPRTNSPDTIDCASCHLAMPARTLVGDQLGLSEAGDPNRFVPDASIPTGDLAQTTTLDTDGILNIHAFSYRDVDPMINQRVINETAANLAYLKSLL